MRDLGQTGILVSAIGLGTVKFGRNAAVKYPAAFQLPADSELHHLLSVAKELGINLLDTAPAYGTSEERIGKILQGEDRTGYFHESRRKRICRWPFDLCFSPAAISRSIERSLQRLRTDYLDIVLVHSDGNDERIILQDEVFATLALLKSAGKIRAYGMSTKTVAGGLLTIDHADVAMVTYNHECMDDEKVIQYAQQKQKGIFIKKALASGHLKMPVSDYLRFALAAPGVTSVIVGTINEAHLRENVGVLDGLWQCLLNTARDDSAVLLNQSLLAQIISSQAPRNKPFLHAHDEIVKQLPSPVCECRECFHCD